MLTGEGVIIVGSIILLITQGAIKLEVLQEKDKKTKILSFIGNTLTGIALLIWIYGITDTLVDWLTVSLLLFIAFGISCAISLVSSKVQKFKWLLPTIVLPSVGIICLGLSYFVIPFTISRDINFLIFGIMISLFFTVNQITKEDKRYRVLMITESIIVYLLTLILTDYPLSQTKPIRLIHEILSTIQKSGKLITVNEDIDPPRRGDTALFRVSIKQQNGQLEEIRYYNYNEEHITLKSTEKFD